MAQLENVKVNGQDAKQWLKQQESEAKSKEISQFLADEFRSFGRMSHRHNTCGGSVNRTRVIAAPNNSIRFA